MRNLAATLTSRYNDRIQRIQGAGQGHYAGQVPNEYGGPARSRPPGGPMGVEVVIEGLTKSFGGQTVWHDVSLSLPAGEVSVMLGPSGTGKTVFLKSLVGLLKPDRGRVLVDGVDIVACSERRPLRGAQAVRRDVPGRRAVRLAEPLRQHRLPAARAHPQDRGRDPSHRAGEDGHGRPGRRRAQGARRDLRRHAQARRAGPRAGPRPADHPVRRARLRPGPGPHRLPVPAAHRPERGDRRDDADRHPRHPDRPRPCPTTSACCSAAD